MGQKTHPVGLRLGIVKGWESNWFGGKRYSDKLAEDEKIRSYIKARLSRGAYSKVVIERTLKRVTLTIHTARPGMIIGKGGEEVEKLRQELKKLTKKEIHIDVFEVKRPELDATLVGQNIAMQLEGRVSYRRAVKTAMGSAMRLGAEGIKVLVAGRLNGVEMARSEHFKDGRIPLNTLRADIDYSFQEALTTYGKIGIKTWIFKGELYGKVDLTPVGKRKKSGQGGKRNDAGGRKRRKNTRPRN